METESKQKKEPPKWFVGCVGICTLIGLISIVAYFMTDKGLDEKWYSANAKPNATVADWSIMSDTEKVSTMGYFLKNIEKDETLAKIGKQWKYIENKDTMLALSYVLKAAMNVSLYKNNNPDMKMNEVVALLLVFAMNQTDKPAIKKHAN